MRFEIAHEQWIKEHLRRRKGKRRDALRRGHGYGSRLFAERVWLELAGHFQGLHPEYEVRDWRGRSYFVHFMWIVGAIRIVFEIMDFGSQGNDRTNYRLSLNRGLYLQSQDCLVFYISLDELKENPGLILSSLRSSLAPYLLAAARETTKEERRFTKLERDLMRAAIRHGRILRPFEAAAELEVNARTIIKYCRELVNKGKFRAVARGASGRVTHYEYVGTIQSPDLV